MTIDVTFLDAGREPKEKPDPNFPDGKRLDLTTNLLAAQCTRNLPFPAPRVGAYVVTCRECGYRVVVTVAGRPDDPSMITMPCKERLN
jgi:hypothetical protein